jgi:hypothetical protein
LEVEKLKINYEMVAEVTEVLRGESCLVGACAN